MRDKRFVAEHRGGLLPKVNHRLLIGWARACSEHVTTLLPGVMDDRLVQALHIAKEWEQNRVTVGDAMKASVGAHAAARESSNPVVIAVARSIGQAVATAHMADHAMGAALYALKAVKLAGGSIEEEQAWQNKQLTQLPDALGELVLSSMREKGKSFKI